MGGEDKSLEKRFILNLLLKIPENIMGQPEVSKVL